MYVDSVWMQCNIRYFIGSISILVFVNFQLSDVTLLISDRDTLTAQ
jgi:hypothetical protein